MPDQPIPVGAVEELRTLGRKVVQVGGVPVLVIWDDGQFHAIDNRCPHMGFPLHEGDVKDGLLDCHWHHARFDLSCGATLDPWADDAVSYKVIIREGQVLVDPNLPPRDPGVHGPLRLRRGLEDNLGLVTAKSVIEMLQGGVQPGVPIAAGAAFGARERARGWSAGLSVLSSMANVLEALEPRDRERALAQALARVARDCAGEPPRHPLPELRDSRRGRDGLRAWFRETVEVRDRDGSERVLRTLVEEHGTGAALDAVLAACTDHRYSDIGHSLDFAIKCAELAERVGDEGPPDTASLLFTSLVPGLVGMERMEETSAWRRPVDVATIVAEASREIPRDAFLGDRAAKDAPLADEDRLVERILGEDPGAAAKDLITRLRDGASPVALAEAVVMAATDRVLRFGTANETPDWDTVHHTLAYANAVAEGMRRVPSWELFRAVLDGAMSVYLDRFLNLPPAHLPKAGAGPGTEENLAELLRLYDQRASVDEAAELAWTYLKGGGDPHKLLATLGHGVAREDSGFHEFQQIDLAWRRLQRRGDGEAAHLALTATARWIASQYPTRRAREQTFQISLRLHRGDRIYEG